ncbi:uncharacterized protein LOC123957619 [Micropterus dolomieu]|uniref:uncharacterized protein LOC123957619 n=1 Tax=Micropterus dolomieu TaxID=147949 RepID=UPI001E8CFD27|nr:uncharacterized protein LOC123957619 [Micropterus dolomieu]
MAEVAMQGASCSSGAGCTNRALLKLMIHGATFRAMVLGNVAVNGKDYYCNPLPPSLRHPSRTTAIRSKHSRTCLQQDCPAIIIIIVDIFGEDSPAFIGLVGVESDGTDLEETAVSPEMDVDRSSECVNCKDSMEAPVTPRSSHEGSSGAPLDNLQQTLLEKEIVRVEAETKKLQAEQEKLELEKQKISLEIQLLQQQINNSSSPISEEDGRSFVIL